MGEAGKERVEACKAHFEEAKRQIHCASTQLEECEPLRVLEKLAANCRERLDKGDKEGLARAAAELRSVGEAQLLHLSEARGPDEGRQPEAAKAGSRNAQLPLRQWRPELVPADAPGDAEAPGCEEGGDGGDEADDSLPEAQNFQAPPELLERKAEADEAVRGGQYAEALCIYDQLLEDTGTVQAENGAAATLELDCEAATPLRVALLCNAALCTLKLSPTQRSWPCVRVLLKRTLELCDLALALDFTSAKAHYRRGCALEALERFSEACEAYEKASRFEPADPAINAALLRSSRYELADLGPEVLATARKQLKVVESKGRPVHPRRPQAAAKPATGGAAACCYCRGVAGSSGSYAVPCGHGPFCRECRERIETEVGGLQVCPECTWRTESNLSSGLIDGWREGPREPPSAPQGAAGRKRPFGPRPPPPSAERTARRPEAPDEPRERAVEISEVEALPAARAEDTHTEPLEETGCFLSVLD